MEFQTIEKTIGQIVKVQKLIRRYTLRQRELQKRNPSYELPKSYYQLRNGYEGIRIQKLKLIREKNIRMSYLSWS